MSACSFQNSASLSRAGSWSEGATAAGALGRDCAAGTAATGVGLPGAGLTGARVHAVSDDRAIETNSRDAFMVVSEELPTGESTVESARRPVYNTRRL